MSYCRQFTILTTVVTAVVWCPPAAACPWDCADRDGNVGIVDFLGLLGGWGEPGPCDFDGGGVRVSDFLELLANWGPCPEMVMQWPMSGPDTVDWVINNYVDLDPTSGLLDYMGGTKTYNGHNGIDIDVPNFRWMDNDFPILAASDGVVFDTNDSNYDRNTSCQGQWNFVTVEHDNGWRTIYGHLKENSVVVTVGQSVLAGQMLGVVGSSGCSTAPHLHLEMRDQSNNVIDPFLEGFFVAPPVYDTPLGFMDAALDDQALTHVDQVKDPLPNITQIEQNGTLGFGISMAGGMPGDQVQLRLLKPDGVEHAQLTYNLNVYRHWYRFNFKSQVGSMLGVWKAQVLLNGTPAVTYDIDVYPIGQQVLYHVPHGDYQAMFNSLVANGYRLTWVDGYQYNGTTYLNAIFDQTASGAWLGFHDLTSSGYQSLFGDLVGQGYRLVHVDSYRLGNEIVYAGLFIVQGGPAWTAYHGVTSSTHQQMFDDLVADGYRPIVISPVESSGGSLRFAALYDKANVGLFSALYGLSESDYQTVFDEQWAAGKTLAYFNGYQNSGQARISAIFDQTNPSNWVARHNMSIGTLESQLEKWAAAGLLARFLSGYQDGSSVNFGAFWSN